MVARALTFQQRQSKQCRTITYGVTAARPSVFSSAFSAGN